MLNLKYFMSVPYRGRKSYKVSPYTVLRREVVELREDLDAITGGLMKLEDTVSTLKPKRGRPKKKK